MTAPPTDGPLALARRRLDDAVHALAEPVPVWHSGVCRWSHPLYTRLRGALTGRGGTTPRCVVFGSRAPCRNTVLSLLVEIDGTVEVWAAARQEHPDRLHQLPARGWRPQDCGLIDDYCEQLERWTVTATELLGDASPTVALRLPCPSCAQRFVYRRNTGGESVRTWALKVAEDGCTCLGCRAFWPPAEFHWLARLLGCEPLPSAV